MLPSVSLLNKITEGNTDIMKTAKLIIYQNGSSSKDMMLVYDMYLQPCVSYSGRWIICLIDEKNVYLTASKQHL